LSVVVAMLEVGGEERVSESESSSSLSVSVLSLLSSSGQSRSAETFVCLPLGPLTHVAWGSLRRHDNSALRVTSYTTKHQ